MKRTMQRNTVGLQAATMGLGLLVYVVVAFAAPESLCVKGTNGDAPAGSASDWPTHGGTYLEQRYSTLDQITPANVSRLGLAWQTEFDTKRGQESTPLVVDGRMFVTTAWSKIEALDAATGKLLWRYDPKVPPHSGFSACCDVVNRGAAYDAGKVFLGSLDGRLIALDARDGSVLWIVRTTDPTKPYTITGAPRVVRGKVIIGNGGADYGVRGYVSAYDECTGAKLWRFYTVPGNPAAAPDHEISDEPLARLAKSTWYGEYWKLGGGGTVYDAIVYDTELNQLYIGVGNGSPWNQRIRSEGHGDNLFLSSIVAIDPDTGRYLWHYQETPGESWDFTATQPIILADLIIDGRPRKVLMQAPKNGFFYVIDRTTGKLLSAQNFVPVTWASRIDLETGRPVEADGARYTKAPFVSLPGGSGAHNWQPMSFSPKTGLVYIPVQELPFLYVDDQKFEIRPGGLNTGIDLLPSIPQDDPKVREAIEGSLKGRLLAWNPVTQKAAWQVEYGKPWNGGVLSTAGGLVFEGTSGGAFDAYDAQSGRPVWKFDAQTGVMAGPISYSVAGRQYVAVVAGYGGAIPLALPSFSGSTPHPNGRVLVFALDAHDELPPPPARLAPPNPGTDSWPAAVVERGRDLYGVNCWVCHGIGTLSAGVLPDLRRSAFLSQRQAWRSVVLGGALTNRGMVSFSRYIDQDDAEAIRAYVSSEARKLPH
jgi:quinohemoprotein ethanol dehydrogenase